METHRPDPIEIKPQKGFVLAFTIIITMGVTAIFLGTIYNSKTGRMTSANYKNKLANFLAADGMVTLLTQEIINGNGTKYIDMTRYGKINGHVWIGLAGDDIRDLQIKMASQPVPNLFVTTNYLGKQVIADNYGTKWFGYLIPPMTGNYTFTTRGDDATSFYLSTDTSKANLSSSPICSLATWVYDWPTGGSAVSAPQALIAGKRYYFEFLQKQAGGFATGQMGWDGPNLLSERPITGRYLSEYSSDPQWNGTMNVGSIPVRYRVLGNGQDIFNIAVEAVSTKSGNPNDTLFRTPLNQNISMLAPASVPPATMKMKVIYYDFRATGDARREFNWNPPLANLGVRTGMVQPTLTTFTNTDADYFGRATIGKPSRTNTFFNNRSCGLNMWFRDWTTVNNVYRYADNGSCTVTDWHAAGDLWWNVKYKDEITFTLDASQGKNVYVYSRMGNYNTGTPATSWRGDPSEFFPLDSKGHDPIGSGHNYGFCLEMHTTFTHRSGLIFEFTGDDDTWAFVNNKLEIDLGGIHGAENRMLVLDNLNLTFGETYNFDFFQCERQQVNSSTRIVTNITSQQTLGDPVVNWRRDYGSVD